MGRRFVNTTKSGKYMNPTDQARKEARKKELKKNKRQKQIVRTAVLRGKDPMQLLGEMEKIDQMEYNALQPSPLNENVLKDKRKKLRRTFDRVMKLYRKDNPIKWEEIRIAEREYEKRRANLLTYYEAVCSTQQVSVDEIPLPIPQLNPDGSINLSAGTPIPNEYGRMMSFNAFNSAIPPPPGILRKNSVYRPPPSSRNSSSLPPGTPNVVSAAPKLINREGDIQPPGEEQPKSSATIEAKAKIRNLKADLTRFLPISVRIKRDEGKPKPKPEKKVSLPIDTTKALHKPVPNPAPNATQPWKDDAYMQFMKEMQ